MRIAVIGSGISGLTAAYLLAPHADVTLYEKEARLGGHAHTALLRDGNTTIPVDTGFMVFNPNRYPYFVSLLQTLDVKTMNTDMSFSVSIPGEVEYSGSIRGLFGDMRQLLNPLYLRFISEIPRFNRIARDFLHQNETHITMGEFLRQHSFSKELAAWYVYPMIASIWSTDVMRIHNFPARETLVFLDNHQLLSIVGGPQWKTISGGSIAYVDALTRKLQDEKVTIKKGYRVERISRSPIQVHEKTVETFDAILLATHADEARTLLSDASSKEHEILGSFAYARNIAVLHNDTSHLPKRKSAWAAWNYSTSSQTEKVEAVSLSYNMNALQHIPKSFPVLVTLNPKKPIAPKAIFSTYEYMHPIANTAARAAQKRLAEIQGNRNTYFVGAHWGNGFHEDGVVSAVEAVKALNIPMRLTL